MSSQTVIQSRQHLILYFHQCHASLLKIEPQAFNKVVAFVRVDGKMRRLPAYFVNPVYGQLCDGHQNVIYSCCF